MIITDLSQSHLKSLGLIGFTKEHIVQSIYILTARIKHSPIENTPHITRLQSV